MEIPSGEDPGAAAGISKKHLTRYLSSELTESEVIESATTAFRALLSDALEARPELRLIRGGKVFGEKRPKNRHLRLVRKTDNPQ